MQSKILLVRKMGNTDRIQKLAGPLFSQIHFFENWEQANALLRANSAEIIFFATSDSKPTKLWLKKMLECLKNCHFVTGDQTFTRKTPEQKTYADIFRSRSKKSTQAKGYALPWASLENFACTKETWEEVGEFSLAADWSTDKDWSWRAILKGKTLGYCESPLSVDREINATKLQEFFDRGMSDAWLQRTYQFLNGGWEMVLPLPMGVDGFERLWEQGNPLRARWAFAYGSGMQWGYSHSLNACKIHREAKQTVYWKSGKNLEVFVPKQGLTQLQGKTADFFLLSRKEHREEILIQSFQKIFRVSEKVAREEVPQFLASF